MRVTKRTRTTYSIFISIHVYLEWNAQTGDVIYEGYLTFIQYNAANMAICGETLSVYSMYMYMYIALYIAVQLLSHLNIAVQHLSAGHDLVQRLNGKVVDLIAVLENIFFSFSISERRETMTLCFITKSEKFSVIQKAIINERNGMLIINEKAKKVQK